MLLEFKLYDMGTLDLIAFEQQYVVICEHDYDGNYFWSVVPVEIGEDAFAQAGEMYDFNTVHLHVL